MRAIRALAALAATAFTVVQAAPVNDQAIDTVPADCPCYENVLANLETCKAHSSGTQEQNDYCLRGHAASVALCLEAQLNGKCLTTNPPVHNIPLLPLSVNRNEYCGKQYNSCFVVGAHVQPWCELLWTDYCFKGFYPLTSSTWLPEPSVEIRGPASVVGCKDLCASRKEDCQKKDPKSFNCAIWQGQCEDRCDEHLQFGEPPLFKEIEADSLAKRQNVGPFPAIPLTDCEAVCVERDIACIGTHPKSACEDVYFICLHWCFVPPETAIPPDFDPIPSQEPASSIESRDERLTPCQATCTRRVEECAGRPVGNTTDLPIHCKRSYSNCLDWCTGNPNNADPPMFKDVGTERAPPTSACTNVCDERYTECSDGRPFLEVPEGCKIEYLYCFNWCSANPGATNPPLPPADREIEDHGAIEVKRAATTDCSDVCDRRWPDCIKVPRPVDGVLKNCKGRYSWCMKHCLNNPFDTNPPFRIVDSEPDVKTIEQSATPAIAKRHVQVENAAMSDCSEVCNRRWPLCIKHFWVPPAHYNWCKAKYDFCMHHCMDNYYDLDPPFRVTEPDVKTIEAQQVKAIEQATLPSAQESESIDNMISKRQCTICKETCAAKHKQCVADITTEEQMIECNRKARLCDEHCKQAPCDTNPPFRVAEAEEIVSIVKRQNKPCMDCHNKCYEDYKKCTAKRPKSQWGICQDEHNKCSDWCAWNLCASPANKNLDIADATDIETDGTSNLTKRQSEQQCQVCRDSCTKSYQTCIGSLPPLPLEPHAACLSKYQNCLKYCNENWCPKKTEDSTPEERATDHAIRSAEIGLVERQDSVQCEACKAGCVETYQACVGVSVPILLSEFAQCVNKYKACAQSCTAHECISETGVNITKAGNATIQKRQDVKSTEVHLFNGSKFTGNKKLYYLIKDGCMISSQVPGGFKDTKSMQTNPYKIYWKKCKLWENESCSGSMYYECSEGCDFEGWGFNNKLGSFSCTW